MNEPSASGKTLLPELLKCNDGTVLLRVTDKATGDTLVDCDLTAIADFYRHELDSPDTDVERIVKLAEKHL